MAPDSFKIEVEERLAFQERALDQLNRVVADQQLELDELSKEVRELRRQRVSGTGTDGPSERRTLEDDRPPHY